MANEDKDTIMSTAQRFHYNLWLVLDCLTHCEITVSDETVSIHPCEDYYYQRGNRLDVAYWLGDVLQRIKSNWEGKKQ